MSYYGNSNNSRLKNIIIFVLIVVLLGAVVGLSVKLFQKNKDGVVQASAYEVGTLSDSMGKYEESYSNIYTKNYIDAKGDVTFELEEDANITYKVFYYDKDKDFISHSSALSADSDQSTFATGTKYIKVVIITQDPEVTEGEIAKYAGRLTITVD